MRNKREKGPKKERQEGDTSKGGIKVNDEFKMALAALTSPEDFAILDEQFFQVKD